MKSVSHDVIQLYSSKSSSHDRLRASSNADWICRLCAWAQVPVRPDIRQRNEANPRHGPVAKEGKDSARLPAPSAGIARGECGEGRLGSKRGLVASKRTQQGILILIQYATGDDRFSFPPVPGYTGYIPRSQDVFGRSFIETTNASLGNFKRMQHSKNKLPHWVDAVVKDRSQTKERTAPKYVPKPPATELLDDMSPYRLPPHHPQKTFISGYTGFVPRLNHYFGEVFPKLRSHIVIVSVMLLKNSQPLCTHPRHSLSEQEQKILLLLFLDLLDLSPAAARATA